MSFSECSKSFTSGTPSRLNFIFDGIKNYILFLWTRSKQSHKNMSVGEVAATLYDCHLRYTENFKYPSPSKNYIWAQIFPVTFIWIQSLPENAELCHWIFFWPQVFESFQSCIWWRPVEFFFRIDIWGYFYAILFKEYEWMANFRVVSYLCDTKLTV